MPQAAEHPPVPQTGGQTVLPRRFRSSALRACGAGRLATGMPGQHAQYAARNIVTVTAPIGKLALGVIHSSSSWSVTRRLHGEWRSTRGRVTATGKRTDDGSVCTLLVINEAEDSWSFHDLGAPGVKLPKVDTVALADSILERPR